VSVNRRTATRHDVAIAATIQLSGSSVESLESKILNLSIGGAFVALDRRLGIGTPVSLVFRIPTHDQAIETASVVRWSNQEGFGVQFDGLRAAEVWSLGRFLAAM